MLHLFSEAEGPDAFPLSTAEGGCVSESALQRCVEMAETKLGLPTRRLRGDAVFEALASRRRGGEDLAAVDIEVPTVRFGSWGRSTFTRPHLGEPPTEVAESARRSRRPSSSGPGEDRNVLENIRLATRLMQVQKEARCNEAAKSTRDASREPQDAERAQEFPPESSAFPRVLDLGTDRQGRERHEGAGVVHVVRVHDEIPLSELWESLCGWKFGKKERHTWRLLEASEEVSAHSICERCTRIRKQDVGGVSRGRAAEKEV